MPIIAKADSMTTDELREFRAHVRAQLEHVRALPVSLLMVWVVASCATAPDYFLSARQPEILAVKVTKHALRRTTACSWHALYIVQ